ncbi:protein disulfide oxidoreductase [Vibrio agarivorans]|uniref:Protein disulfide oxidoreductase n=1 Tax=Vibrio agarivorans TaxID=153622 RepID=A0ABT7Y5Z4_9VIBR|nr:protein disulfide oxidoreductase [Vibrio agarivorans]MDN2483476.1 protein disulfide oxidoreductase [Vibrio agarivorans]
MSILTKAGSFIKKAAIYLVLFITLSTAVDWYRTSNSPTALPPSMMAKAIDGDAVDLVAQSYESPVVIYFWATWCSVCRFVSPSLSWVSNYYPTYAVALNSGSDRRVSAYVQQHSYQFETINDSDGSWMRQWQIAVTPTTYVIHQGEIQSVTTGFTTPLGVLARIWLS